MDEIKQILTNCSHNAFSIPESVDQQILVDEMLRQIGSTDSSLRDELIYTCFSTWIVRLKTIPPEQLRHMLDIILDKWHMFFHIGEKGTDSIFTRSFSVLIIPLILYTHRQQPFLEKTEILSVKEKLIQYLAQENDLRGFVAEKGWAHAIAHSADALDELVQCDEMGRADLTTLMEMMLQVMSAGDSPFVYEEDERMVTAFVSMLNRKLLQESDLYNAIDHFCACALNSERDPLRFTRYNARIFLRSLYFRLLGDDKYCHYLENILAAERKLNRYV